MTLPMLRLLPAIVAIAGAAAACGSSGGAKGPSTAARMVCAREAATELAAALGVPTTGQPTHTWADQTYSCRYVYPSGTMLVSVKDTASTADATAYFVAMRTATASPVSVPGLGQEAFAAGDGSVYVRKDVDVLHVDVSGLPATFGRPTLPRSQTAIAVATAVMHCWSGG